MDPETANKYQSVLSNINMIKFSCGYFIFGDFWAEFQSKSASFQFLEGQIHKIFFAPKLLYVIYVQHTSGKTDWCISQMIKSYH